MEKIITVYTAIYYRSREDGLPGKVEVEDDCSYPMMFDTEESAIAGTREHAKKNRLDYNTGSAETQFRWAIQLDNGKRFLLSNNCGGEAVPRFFVCLLRIVVRFVNRHILDTVPEKIEIAVWSGEGKPPGDCHTKVILKVASNYYLLDSWDLIGLRAHYDHKKENKR